MTDLYQLYERGFVDQVILKDKKQLRAMQIVTFKYKGSNDKKVVLSLNDYPENKYFHCIKLNGISLPEFFITTSRLVDKKMLKTYTEAYRQSVLDETMRLNEYRLPLVAPVSEIDQQEYYNQYFRRNSLVKKHNAYRTYIMSEITNMKIVVPNLKYFSFIPRFMEIDKVEDLVEEKIKTIESVRKWDDTNIDEFTEQDKFID